MLGNSDANGQTCKIAASIGVSVFAHYELMGCEERKPDRGKKNLAQKNSRDK